MKAIAIALAALLFAGCTTSTKYGPCVGILDKKDPALRYDLAVLNVFLGVVFSETVVLPVYVVAKALECPEGKYEHP